MPTILLIRHAQAAYGTEHYDRLSYHGLDQARATADELVRRGVRVDHIVSGSLARQRQTADPIAAATGATVEVDARWNEYDAEDILSCHSVADVGLEAKPGVEVPSPAEFQERLDDALGGWIAAGESGPATETWPAFARRVAQALVDVAESLGRGQTAVVCTSGGALAAACAHLLEADPRLVVALNRVSVNAGITKVISGARGTRVLSFNDHAHLEHADGSLITFR